MKRFLFIVVILTFACTSEKPKFNLGTCYSLGLKKNISHEEIIRDIVMRNYENNENVYGIEIRTPTFNSIVVFSDENRQKAFRLNYQNGRIDRFNRKEESIIQQIKIDDFTHLMETHNDEQITISKFSFYDFYKFSNAKLVYKKTIVNRKMKEELMIKNHLDKIFNLLNTFDDKRKPCSN